MSKDRDLCFSRRDNLKPKTPTKEKDVNTLFVEWKRRQFDDFQGNNHFKEHLQNYDTFEDMEELIKEFGKYLLKEGSQQTLKDVLKIIDKNILLNEEAIRYYDNPEHTLKIRLGLVIDELNKLKEQIEKQLGEMK
jgi:hypothetical protein